MIVALNPFKWLPHMYTDTLVHRYHGGDMSYDDLLPHIFQVSQRSSASVR
jgi:myosin heavy subunit